MNDILPPKRPLNAKTQPPTLRPQPVGTTPPAEVPPALSAPQSLPQKKKRRVWAWVLLALLGLAAIALGAAVVWYKVSLSPVNVKDTSRSRITITEGMSPSAIGSLLEENKLIRSKYAFDIYTRLSDTRSKLQAGAYALSPSETTQAIVGDIVSGKVDGFSLTFLPGATIKEDKEALVKAGFSSGEVDMAFGKVYNHPLFASKPLTADLEGYIYGETYKFNGDATVEQILTRTFDEYYQVIKGNDLISAFKKQGLTLYQGITLASIIQREVPNATDQKQVAQIFLKRYREGITLGSDITAYYGADKEGLTRSVATDTPYNTRIHKGLPPGPIASPGLTALQAVAHPAAGDYLYFLSGDDDITYYAKTEEEHQANITNHCQVKCAVQ
jgi:UPF0755 protein